jgi:Eph receptor A4
MNYYLKDCPLVIYDMMLDCWEADRLKRPKFRQIVSNLDILLGSQSESLFVLSNKSK